jgi:uncharacterized alpha/beta hydrolase family protein
MGWFNLKGWSYTTINTVVGEQVGQEILEEIESLCSRGYQIKQLSFVGYSLGGLVARYGIGLFESMGIFKDIQPVVSDFVPIHYAIL